MLPSLRSAFTLIELLIVIAVIGILTVVVLLVINPAELLRQSRDSSRLSDMATASVAVNLYLEDFSGTVTLGTASTSYISAADPSATSTNQCQGLGLPALATSSGQNWQCSAPSTFRKVNATGWIPLNFSILSTGSPMGSLPVDPVNQSTANLFYSYSADGTQYAITTLLESQKYKQKFTNDSLFFPEVIIRGNTPSASILYNPTGLVGYWNMDEAPGATALDLSGSGNNGTWHGTPAGSNGYYSGGNVGSWAGYFNGSDDYASSTNPTNIPNPANSNYSLSAWVNLNQTVPASRRILAYSTDASDGYNLYIASNKFGFSGIKGGTLYEVYQATASPNTWYHVVGTFDTNLNVATLYVNGVKYTGGVYGSSVPPTYNTLFLGARSVGDSNNFSGLIDDIRIYNRVLSPAEIQAIYNADK